MTTAVIAGIAGVAGIANIASASDLIGRDPSNVFVYPYYQVPAAQAQIAGLELFISDGPSDYIHVRVANNLDGVGRERPFNTQSTDGGSTKGVPGVDSA